MCACLCVYIFYLRIMVFRLPETKKPVDVARGVSFIIFVFDKNRKDVHPERMNSEM